MSSISEIHENLKKELGKVRRTIDLRFKCMMKKDSSGKRETYRDAIENRDENKTYRDVYPPANRAFFKVPYTFSTAKSFILVHEDECGFYIKPYDFVPRVQFERLFGFRFVNYDRNRVIFIEK